MCITAVSRGTLIVSADACAVAVFLPGNGQCYLVGPATNTPAIGPGAKGSFKGERHASLRTPVIRVSDLVPRHSGQDS